jgi:hypothetical protein
MEVQEWSRITPSLKILNQKCNIRSSICRPIVNKMIISRSNSSNRRILLRVKWYQLINKLNNKAIIWTSSLKREMMMKMILKRTMRVFNLLTIVFNNKFFSRNSSLCLEEALEIIDLSSCNSNNSSSSRRWLNLW